MTAHQRKLLLLGTIGLAVAGAAFAQSAPPANSATALRLPSNPKVFGSPLPQVVKATAIVNGEVITQTDIDQRIALLAIASGQAVPEAELDRLRQQVLRNLIDETLQIQAAKAEEILVKPADIDRTVARVAGNVKQTPEQMASFLTASGSSIRTIRRQIEGEIAWRRLQSAKIESGVSVGDDEVKAVIDKLEAAKGSDEYRIGEIFLAATPVNRAEVLGNANKIITALQQGASFAGYARQYSEASTSAVGGDLGWVRPEQLPEAIGTVVRQMAPNSLSAPIAVPGGFSIVALARQAQGADRRSARRRAQPQAGVDQDPRGHAHARGQCDGGALRHRRAIARRLRRGGETRRGLQGRSRPVGRSRAEGTSQPPCRT